MSGRDTKQEAVELRDVRTSYPFLRRLAQDHTRENVDSPWAYVLDEEEGCSDDSSESPSPLYELFEVVGSTAAPPNKYEYVYCPEPTRLADGRPRASTPIVPPLYLHEISGLDKLVVHEGASTQSSSAGTSRGGGALSPVTNSQHHQTLYRESYCGNRSNHWMCSSLLCNQSVQSQYESV